jgi:F-type H+-transporting ATPase subunit b
MKHIISKLTYSYILILVFFLFYACGEAFASETVAAWRPTYDIVMIWVNFLILAFILIKFLRKPLKNFLKGKSDDIKIEIEKIEQEKERVSDGVNQALLLLEKSDNRLKGIKQRIMAQGERERERTIEHAKEQSERMIEDAKRKIESYILTKHMQLKSEIVDEAMEYALEKLPTKMSEEDNDKFVDNFLKYASPDK